MGRAGRAMLPEGVHDLLPELAACKRTVENKILSVFARWGYREAVTPVFEYSSVFDGVVDEFTGGSVYRFMDERGRSLVLRPDLTAPLARVAATSLAAEPRPLRLCYCGNIYRHVAGLTGHRREMVQAGVELIGAGSTASDAEAVALAAEALKAAGLGGFKICIGHVGFLETLLGACGVDGENGELAKRYLNVKDFVSLRQLVEGLGLAPSAREALLGISTLRGGREVLAKAATVLPAGCTDVLLQLSDMWEMLEEYGVEEHVALDLSLVRDMAYYTGMVFEGYAPGLGFPVCGGGRYDRLLSCFGMADPAVGFGISIDNLLALLNKQGKLPRQAEAVLYCYDSGGRQAAFARARLVRAAGCPVIVDTRPRSLADAHREAARLGERCFRYFDGSGGEKEVETAVAGGEES